MNLFNSYSSLIKSSGAGDKVCALLDLMPPPPGTGSSQVLAHAHEHDSPTGREQCSISLLDVHFRYPSRPEQRVLNGINLQIPVGKTVALVGPSGKLLANQTPASPIRSAHSFCCCNEGCGKSTILALLQRFYDPTCGSVVINGVDLSMIDIKAHR